MTEPRDLPKSSEEKRALLARLLEERAARPRSFPLSFAQQRLWFLDQLGPGSSAYNVWAASRLAGSVRPAHLQAAFREVVRRHQILRTTFTQSDGQPVQVVADDASPVLPLVDLGALPGPRGQDEARRLVSELAYFPFDLARGPLVRAVLLRLDGATSVLVAALHHIIADGWSLGLFIRELSAIYQAFAAGQPSPLPPLPLQYVDFVRWQRQWLRGEVLEEQLAYWKGRLANASHVLELPTDRPRPPVQTFHGASLGFVLKPELHASLQALARQEGLTLFMVLLASFQTLLHRVTAQDDLSVGSAIAGRNRKELTGLIGLFANTLVLSTDLSGEPSFRELLGRVREVALGAYAHQDMPFEKLVEAIQPQRDVSRTPLIQVAFALQNTPDAALDLPGADPLGGERQTAKVDLTLEMAETPEGLAGILEYNRDLFDRATILRLAGCFERLMAAATAHPETRIDDLPLLADWERAQLLAEWSTGPSPAAEPALLHEQVARQAALQPDAVAVQLGSETLTYGELEERSNRLAHHLRRRGARIDAPIALCLDRSLRVPVGLLAILKAGGVYVPLDPAYPQERLRWILEDCFTGAEAPLLVTETAHAGVFRGADGQPIVPLRLVLLDEHREEIAAESAAPLSGGPVPESLAYAIFTSGSTGRPKGVGMPHSALANLLAAVQRLFGAAPGDRVLQFASLSFDVSLFETSIALTGGATLCLASRHDLLPGPGLIRLLRDLRITLSVMPPPVLAALPQEDLPDLHTLIVGGEAWSLALVRPWARGRRLFNGYGPTEVAVAASLHRLHEDDERLALGRPFERMEFFVVDRHLRPVPVGVAGELHIGGRGLGRGYLGRPELTAAAFLPHPFSPEPGARWYRTGDLVRHLHDGRVEYLGRIGRQVKIRGFRIELEEIEAILVRHPAVRSAAVAVREEHGEKSLAAWIVPGDAPPTPGEVREFLRERLPEYMVPARIIPLDALPLNANNKIDRRALLALIPAEEHPGEEAWSAPASDLERTIADLWREVLGVERVGVHDNFFDLGGHSLRLVTIHTRLQQALGREIPIVDLFQHPSVGALARHLELGREPGTQAPPDFQDLEAVRARASRQATGGGTGAGFAVVGMAGRFPGAADLDRFWENLRDGIESIEPLSDEALLAAGVDPGRIASPNYVKASPVLAGIDLFDAGLFGFNPREAELLDPQHRLFLESGWQALEHAGYDPRRFRGAIGVYAGAQSSTYVYNLVTHPEILESLGIMAVQTGVDKDFLATRLSYLLDLKGPSVTVQTACSTSLVAVHMACRALAAGECDLALAGGVTVRVPQEEGYLYIEGGISSPDGHCRAFDAQARGTIFGSGVGVVVLKRLEEALADGDTIHAVVRGTAINNDGSLKVGFTAPSVEGQAQVIAAAQAAAGVAPDSISYVEAHGTATPLGDPIEVAALTRAFRAGTDRVGFCALGSVKTNVGHLDAAAGITGFLKTVLALRERQIPPSLHFEEPNPKLDLAASPFYVAARRIDWPAGDEPRRAGVSSFGVGGTNAHAVLEEAPPPEPSGPSRPHQLLLLSARTPEALDEATANLARHLSHPPEADLADLADLAFTLQVGRRELEHRRMLVCDGAADAANALGARDAARLLSRHQEAAGRRSVVFLFPGQGAQHIDMARGLYDTEPVFRRELDACAELLLPRLGRDLRRLLHPAPEERETAERELRQTRFAQPALFAVELALARLWLSWGITPWAMIGHSLGEYVAACLAGVLTPEDALGLVANRGELMQELPAGAMLSVDLAADDLLPLLGDGLALAAVNAPALCIASGPEERIAELEARLAARGAGFRRLHTSHAFHSAMMEPILARFAERVRKVPLHPPRLRYLSNLTGAWITAEEATDPAYWTRHLRETVRFGDGLARLLAEAPGEAPVLLEAGPGRTLGSLARKAPTAGRPAPLVVSSLRHPNDAEPDSARLLDALGRLWLAGVEIDWPGFYEGERRRRVPLPTYPFQRRRFWIDRRPWAWQAGAAPTAPRRPAGNGLWELAWERAPLPGGPPAAASDETWLLVAPPETVLATRLAALLEEAGRRVQQARSIEETGDTKGLRIALLVGDPGEDLLRLAHRGAPAAIVLVTDRLQNVAGEAPAEVDPGQAAALGLLRAFAREHPEIVCRAVDVAFPQAGGWREDRLARQLVAELLSGAADPLIAWRGRDRWAGTPMPVPSTFRGEMGSWKVGDAPTGLHPVRASVADWGVSTKQPDGTNQGILSSVETPQSATDGLPGATPSGRLQPTDAYNADRQPGRTARLPLPAAMGTAQEPGMAFRGDMGSCVVGDAPTGLHPVRASVADWGVSTERDNLPDRPDYGTVRSPGATERTLWLAGNPGQVPAILAEELARQGWTITEPGSPNPPQAVLFWTGRTPTALADLHPEDLAPLVQTTVSALAALEDALQDHEPAFCLILSPLAGALGDPGHAADAAVSAVVDAFVRAHNERHDAPWTRASLEDDLAGEPAGDTLRRLLSLDPGASVWLSAEDPLARITNAPSHAATLAGHTRPALATPYVAPRDEAETRLAAMWQGLLGIEPVGVHDDFFELGGHSLLATQVLSRIYELLHVEVSWDAFFAGPTVAAIAGHVRAAQTTGEAPPPPPLAPVPRDGDLSLSFAQERLWFLDQLEPESEAYNIPIALRLRGRLDPAAFAAALDETVRRHESLRTTFGVTPAGEGVQRIAESRPVDLPLLDLRALPAAARHREALRLAGDEARRPFDLAQGPLLRIRRAVLGDEESLLLATMHHIISDGWSIGVLVREIATLYHAFAERRPSPLPDLALQYADFAAWQRQWLAGEVLDNELAWWRERLHDLPVLELPTDRPRPLAPAFRGRNLPFRLSPGLTEALQALSRRQGGTLFMTLLAAWQILLARQSGQDDFAVGTPIAGRNHLRTEELIGFFVNTLVLRADLSGNPRLDELLARVRQAALGAYAHQDLPFEKIVEELQPARSLAHAPLFQVMFVLQNAALGRLDLPGLTLEPFVTESETARFELTLSLTEEDGGVSGLLESNTALFDASTARRLVAHLTAALEGMAAGPERLLSELPLWSAAERAQALHEWNDTAREPEWEAPVHELFAAWAERTPHADALVFQGEVMSYGELKQRTGHLAAHLRALGVGPESLVAISLAPSPEMIVALLAVLEAGGAYVPLDPGYPAERLARMLEDSQATVLLTRERFQSLAMEAAPALGTAWKALPGSAAYVIYTSGSTGTPKGVVALHGGLMSFTRSMADLLRLGPGDRMLQFASLAFDASAVQIFPPLVSGAAVVLHPDPRKLSPAELLDLCARERVTVLDLPAALWRQWVAEVAASGAEIAAPLRFYLTGGEAVPTAVLRDWAGRVAPGVGFLSSYGPTEATVTTTAFVTASHRVGALDSAEVPLGEPLANVRVYLLDAALQPVPLGVPGEVCIGGAGVTRGYLHQPALTAERFLPDPWAARPGARLYRTGDLARRLPDGTLQFLGRRDHQVKLRGFRIELGEIEAALGACPGVREKVVLVHQGHHGERRLLAFVVPERPGELSPDEVLDRLRATLPEPMVPSFVLPLPELPISPTGKLDRRALAHQADALDLAHPRRSQDLAPPRTELELELVQIWEDLLGVRPIGIRDSFFEVGGHSLLAVRLMAQIRGRLGRDLPLAALFEEPTVEHLARRLEAGGGTTPWRSLVPLQPHGEKPPFFCVHPIGGEVLCYYPLAQHLGPDRPFYGLQAPALADERTLARPGIERMAADYLAEIRAVRPHGPYLLGGLSFGGVVAFEMAQQLAREGEEVPLVALLDTAVSPGNDEPAPIDPAALIAGLSREQARQHGRDLELTADDLRGLGMEEQLEKALDELRTAGVVGAEIDIPLFRHFIEGYLARREAVERYKARPYPGRLALFRSSEVDPELLRNSTPDWQRSFEDPTFGWGALAAAGVEVHHVPGYHETMVAEPNAPDLARFLRACLSAAEEGHEL